MKKPLFIWMLLSLAAAQVAVSDTVVEEIIARVNNQIITRSEYLRSKEQLKQEAEQNPDSTRDYAERERDVLRDLVDQQLLLERGKDLDITGDTEVIKRLDQMRKEMKLGSMEELEEEAKKQGVSFEDYKQNLKNQIITQQVIGREVGSRMNMTQEEMQKFYEEHKEQLKRPEEVRLSEILIAVHDNDDEQQVAAAQAKAEALLAELKKGAAFDEVAKKSSEGPSAAQGGDLGYFKRGVLAKELEDKTFAMNVGEYSEPIRTRQGFDIIKLVEHHQEGIPTYKEIEPRIQDAIYMQKLQPALRAYLAHLREDAYIDIKPGYIDTGASAKQTKPVETTAKNENAKALKKKKKFILF